MENYQACDKYSGDHRGRNKSDQGFANSSRESGINWLSVGRSVALRHVPAVADKLRGKDKTTGATICCLTCALYDHTPCVRAMSFLEISRGENFRKNLSLQRFPMVDTRGECRSHPVVAPLKSGCDRVGDFIVYRMKRVLGESTCSIHGYLQCAPRPPGNRNIFASRNSPFFKSDVGNASQVARTRTERDRPTPASFTRSTRSFGIFRQCTIAQ